MRYNYGKEGSRKDYTPYSCLKIISTTPGVVRGISNLCCHDPDLRAACLQAPGSLRSYAKVQGNAPADSPWQARQSNGHTTCPQRVRATDSHVVPRAPWLHNTWDIHSG